MSSSTITTTNITSSNGKKRKSECLLDEEAVKEMTRSELEKKVLELIEELSQEKERADKAEAKAAATSKGDDDEESDIDDEDDDDEEGDDPWNLKYIELREYFALNANFAVPRSGAHSKLSIWIKNQKACYRNVKNNAKGKKSLPNVSTS